MLSSNYSNRLFGRTRGRSKKKNYLKNYYETVNKFKFQNFNEETEYILDVGTGYGETSIFLAKQFPDNVIISCEKYIDGNIILLKNIEINKIKNIRLHNGNVYDILESINKKYFKLVWIFFPDPWPKNRHKKRRTFNALLVEDLSKKLKKKGFIHFATDHSDYFLEALILMNQFNYIIKDIGPDSWKYNEFNALNTKFEKKALDKNHKLFYFSVLKNY